jgi:hypothetical protein
MTLMNIQLMLTSKTYMALMVPCPECKQLSGAWCVYVTPTNALDSLNSSNSKRSIRMRALLERVGKHTKKLHNNRYKTVSDKAEKYKIERQEYQLRRWVMKHGHIIIEIGIPDEM